MRDDLVAGDPHVLDAWLSAGRNGSCHASSIVARWALMSRRRIDVQLSGAEAVATSQLDRLEPELAGAVLSLDVHVRRLIAVEAGEEEPIGPRDALDSWHCGIFAP